MSGQGDAPGAGGQRATGVLFVVSGLAIGAAVAGVWPFAAPVQVNGPVWLGYAAAAVFALAGVAIGLQSTAVGPVAGAVAGVGIVVGLTAIANWVAFGDGVRNCTGSISLPFFARRGEMGDLGCRLGFGYGAVLMNAVTIVAVGHLLVRLVGDTPTPRAVSRTGEVAVLVILAPLLVVVVLVGLVTGQGRLVLDTIRKRWRGSRGG